jgi:sugar phosphate isomerase/epimerase
MHLGIIANPEVSSFHQDQVKGLEFLEFCINIGSDIDAFVAKMPALKQASKESGIKVGSIGRWGADRIGKQGIVEEELQTSFRLIDTAAELGCPNFVCGVNYVEELSYFHNALLAIEYFSKLIEYGAPKGVSISAYNCHWNNFVDNDMAWTIIQWTFA